MAQCSSWRVEDLRRMAAERRFRWRGWNKARLCRELEIPGLPDRFRSGTRGAGKGEGARRERRRPVPPAIPEIEAEIAEPRGRPRFRFLPPERTPEALESLRRKLARMTVRQLEGLADSLSVPREPRWRKARLVEALLPVAIAASEAGTAEGEVPEPSEGEVAAREAEAAEAEEAEAAAAAGAEAAEAEAEAEEAAAEDVPGELREPQDLERAQLCWRWTKCLRTRTDDGWDVDVVPRGTVLFHGTRATFPDGILPNAPAYFAELGHPMHYAFNSGRWSAEEGKVITAMAARDIPLLAITRENLGRLSVLPHFPASDFRAAFPFGVRCDRVSSAEVDKRVTAWICDVALPALPFPAQGWAFPVPRCFHDEIVVCNPEGLVRTPLEIRFALGYGEPQGRYHPPSATILGAHMLITWNGRIVDIVPSRCLKPLPPDWDIEKRYEPKPGHERASDAYLLERGWDRRAIDIATGRAPRPSWFIDFLRLLGIKCSRKP